MVSLLASAVSDLGGKAFDLAVADSLDVLLENLTLFQIPFSFFVEEFLEHLEASRDCLIVPSSSRLSFRCCPVSDAEGGKRAVVEADANFLAELVTHPKIEANGIDSHNQLVKSVLLNDSRPRAGQGVK